MKILKKHFGITKDKKNIYEYTLKNSSGFSVSILNYGGIITKIMCPNKFKEYENVVLSFDNLKDYEDNLPYLGCIIGPVAGRISKAKFTIDNEEYTLHRNNGNNSIHGGINGLNKKKWEVEEICSDECLQLILTYFSKDLENGYPGNLHIKVIYTLYEENKFKIEYEAHTDKKTIINMTNHTYFNLSGNVEENILNHSLYLNGDKFLPLDEELIPLGYSKSIENTPFDFTHSKRIGNNIYDDNNQLNICGGYDHPFVLNNSPKLKAKLEHKNSGRILEIYTDRPSVVLYTGNFLNETSAPINSMKAYKYMGLCLETQDFPDYINQPNFNKKFYDENFSYRAYTIYKFL